MFSGKTQGFSLPSAFRRRNSRARESVQYEQEEEYKAQHILGISRTLLDTARNRSVSSSITGRPPGLAFSDTTTELGSSSTPPEMLYDMSRLQLKASSVLLHEEFNIDGEKASIHSRRMKPRGSSSTLRSFYETQRTPLANSQQTPDSSRGDLGSRKDSPRNLKASMFDKNSPRSMRILRSFAKFDRSDSRKLSKPNPSSSSSVYLPGGSVSQRSVASSKQQSAPTPPSHLQNVAPTQAKTSKGVRFHGLKPALALASRRDESLTDLNRKSDLPNIKVNVRRPKAGTKYWFDGLETESSEEESFHEPEFSSSFVSGMESAFESGRFDPLPKEGEQGSKTTTQSRGCSLESGSQTAKSPTRYHLPLSAIPPRVSTLRAKASRASLARTDTPSASNKPKTKPLDTSDLHNKSVLDLSSSDDDEASKVTTEAEKRVSSHARDSISKHALRGSEILVKNPAVQGIASTASAPHQAVPEKRRVKGGSIRQTQEASKGRRKHGSAYLSDQSSDVIPDETDLIISFPATPIDPILSRRSSRYGSDTASIESRRLMSVTRQEESLLAAMRLKKVALGQVRDGASNTRGHMLRDKDRSSRQQHQSSPRASRAREVLSTPPARKLNFSQSTSPEIQFDQASCTTFQTGLSYDASHRLSFASYGTETSVGPDPDLSSPFPLRSPSSRPVTSTTNRMSRATFFSTSTGTVESLEQGHPRKDKGQRRSMAGFQQIPLRDDTSSQDFIDWPYYGWENTSKVAAAR